MTDCSWIVINFSYLNMQDHSLHKDIEAILKLKTSHSEQHKHSQMILLIVMTNESTHDWKYKTARTCFFNS